MKNILTVALGSAVLALSLSACASPPREAIAPATGSDRPSTPAGVCDATPLAWAVGQVADDALVERARREAGASSVRVLRPGMMVTNEFDAKRLDIRVDTERKVLATSCG
jgi:hypothetical protein